MPSSRIVACDQDITRINSTAPESEGIRLRKVEAAARGFDLGQGDVSVLENCRLPHLLVGQHGASQAWPLPQKPIALALLSTFPRNGVPDPNEDEFYEVVYDEDAGHFVMRRRVDERTGGLPTRIGRPSRSRRSATGRARRSAPGAQVPAMAASQLNACARRGPGKLWLTFRGLAQAFSSRRTCESRFPRAIFERRRHPPRKLR